MSGPTQAHGIWGHVHVTGWAIENLPASDLKDFFSDPQVLNAALFGAAFTDSGYWPQAGELAERSRAYSEHTHWEPFIAEFLAWIIENDPPPWTSLESKKRVAFMMGCAAHGLQDELFDSLFLYQVEARDQGGQDEADPGTDGFLVQDGHARFMPTQYIPMETLLELYQSLEEDVDEETITKSVSVMESFYLNEVFGWDVAEAAGGQFAEALPWTRLHYLDPDVPGSLRAEIFPTMRYLQGIWMRLHGTLMGADVVGFAYPEQPRRLRSHDHTSVDSWATLVFTAGVSFESAAPTWVDEAGVPVPFTMQNTRWGGAFPRLIRLTPSAPLRPGGRYTIELPAGADVIDGFEMDAPYTFEFQVACAAENLEECEELGDIPAASIDGPAQEVVPEPEPDQAPPAPPTQAPAAGEGCAQVGAGSTQLIPQLLLLLAAALMRRRLAPDSE